VTQAWPREPGSKVQSLPTPQLNIKQPARPRRDSARPPGVSGPQGRLGNNANHLSHAEKEAAKVRKSEEQTSRLTMRMAAARLVGEHRRAQGDERLDRIEHCMWTVQDRTRSPRLVYNAAQDRNTLHDVQTCKHRSCPWCVHDRARRDMLELTVAVAAAEREGLATFMVTLTMRHHEREPLAALLNDMLKAKAWVFSGRWFRAWRDAWGVVGHVRYTEITDGENGWHPHFHLVFFARPDLADSELEALEGQLTDRWLTALERRGRAGLSGIAVNVARGHSETARYLAKQGKLPERKTKPGIEFEAAYAPSKKARADASFAPLELLAVAAGLGDVKRYAGVFTEDDETAAIERAGRRWLEYFLAIKGRQIVAWSDGLKERWAVDAETDILELKDTEGDIVLGVIPDWIVLRSDVRLLVAVLEAGNDVKRIEWLLTERGVLFIPVGEAMPGVEF
jgi:hypothetical protein